MPVLEITPLPASPSAAVRASAPDRRFSWINWRGAGYRRSFHRALRPVPGADQRQLTAVAAPTAHRGFARVNRPERLTVLAPVPPSVTASAMKRREPGRAGILRRRAVHPTISAPGGHGMILIERGVDRGNTTYRVSLAGADP